MIYLFIHWNCLKIIAVRWEYLKPYNCVQTNDYHQIEIITWNHSIVYKLSEFDRNTSNITILCKLFVSYRNTWYHNCFEKKRLLRNSYTTYVNINLQRMRFPNLLA